MTALSEVYNDSKYKQYLDKGFVGLVETMGSDETIEQSARMSYGKGTRQSTETRTLLRYLMRHWHTSPFEMGEVRFHLKVPIFVMRQLVRHRTASLNEYSARYSEMTDEFYLPDGMRLQEQSKTNKQGSGEELDTGSKQSVAEVISWCHDSAYRNYQVLLDKGLTRELSRIVLPVSNYTELYWKCDLNNFFKFLRLRLDPHAQWEIVQLAQAMYDLVKPHFPISCEAFEDYQLNGVSFSAKEMEIIRTIVQSHAAREYVDSFDEHMVNAGHLSKRELAEFRSKLRL